MTGTNGAFTMAWCWANWKNCCGCMGARVKELLLWGCILILNETLAYEEQKKRGFLVWILPELRKKAKVGKLWLAETITNR